MRARALFRVALLVAVAVAPACSSSPSTAVAPPGGAGYGGRFVYPLRSEPVTLNFVTRSDQTSDYVARLGGDRLVHRVPYPRSVARLAASRELGVGGGLRTSRQRRSGRCDA